MAGILPGSLMQNCACGTKFSVEHSFSCPKGGFPSIHHNKIHDLTANLLSEVCQEVEIEPTLQPVTGEHFHPLILLQILMRVLN